MPKTQDLLSRTFYDVFSFANNEGLNLIDALMAVDIQQSLLIERSHEKGKPPTQKQIEFYSMANSLLKESLYKDPELDKIFIVDVEKVFIKYPQTFVSDSAKSSFIHKRLDRYRLHKPELFDFLAKVEAEIQNNKVALLKDKVA